MFCCFAESVEHVFQTFLDVQMPERFVLECLTSDGEWLDHGLFQADEFERQADGAYLNAKDGSPMWLRCLGQDGRIVYSVDGGGGPHAYRLVSFPGGGYEENQ